MSKDYILLPKENPNGSYRVKCKNCQNIDEHHAKGLCYNCYKKVGWKREKITCKGCGRQRYHKAFGLCGGCHVRLHHYDNALAYNAKKYHSIDYELYKEITKKCDSCDFTKIVQIHHLDGQTRNNLRTNIVGLCPNCHKMIHTYKYYEEIKQNLVKKGFDVSNVHPTNYVKSEDNGS